jgi:hypothetical protein
MGWNPNAERAGRFPKAKREHKRRVDCLSSIVIATLIVLLGVGGLAANCGTPVNPSNAKDCRAAGGTWVGAAGVAHPHVCKDRSGKVIGSGP